MKYKNIILQIILGYILADIFTGSFHWFEDTYLDYCINMKFFSTVSKENELHHYFPRAMLALSNFESIKEPSTLFEYFSQSFLDKTKNSPGSNSFSFNVRIS